MEKVVIVGMMLVASCVQAAEPMVFRASAKVSIDASGTVTSVEPSASLSPALQAMVKQQVSGYRFEAPLQKGVKSAGVTYVSLGGCAVPDGDSYKISMAYKGAGPLIDGGVFTPPKFPVNAYRNGNEADAVVTYVISEGGSASVEAIRYGKIKGPQRDFDKAIADWVKGFHYATEMVAGHPVRTRMEVPVAFELTGGSMSSFEKQVRQERVSSPECRAAATLDVLEPVALDSPFKRLPSG